MPNNCIAISLVIAVLLAPFDGIGGETPDDKEALALLRERIRKAVGEGKKVETHVDMAGARTKVKIVKCDTEALLVRGGGLDVSLKWSALDQGAIADASRGIVSGDGEGQAAGGGEMRLVSD